VGERMGVVGVWLWSLEFVVTPTLAGMFTAGTFVAGRQVETLTVFSDARHGAATRVLARALYWVLPHLDRLNIADQVVYGEHVPVSYLVTMTGYAAAYTAILLLLGGGLCEGRGCGECAWAPRACARGDCRGC